MRTVINTIIGFVLAGFLLNGLLAVGRASIVHKNADVFIANEACPTKALAGSCVVTGDKSEDFVSGDTTIELRDGSVIYVPRQYVRGASWQAGEVSYKTWPILVLAAAGLALAGCLFGVWRMTLQSWDGTA